MFKDLDDSHDESRAESPFDPGHKRPRPRVIMVVLTLLAVYVMAYFSIRHGLDSLPETEACRPEEASCIFVPVISDGQGLIVPDSSLSGTEEAWAPPPPPLPLPPPPPPPPPPSELSDAASSAAPPHHNPADPSWPGPLVAVIVETQMAPNLVPLILHFSTVLGPDWTIILFTLEKSFAMPSSAPFIRLVEEGGIDIRFLPAGTDLSGSTKVSNFLSKPWLWEQVEWAHRVLFFQLDSIICSRSPRRVDDFLEYDFVGAPISQGYGEGYNGGFCLRNPRVFLEIAREADFENQGPGRRIGYEDQWFYAEAKKRVESRGVRLAPVDEAVKFSVETIYGDRPLGYHQPNLFNPDHQDEIATWCPEVKLVVGKRAM